MDGFRWTFPAFEILSAEQAEELHRGVLQVLEETGVRIDHARGRSVLHDAGCRVDSATGRVRFPPSLVESTLALCPKRFRVRALDPKNDITIGNEALYFMSSCGKDTIDLTRGEARPATHQETLEGIRVLDALEHLHFFGSFSPYFGWQGLPPVMSEPEMTAAKARLSAKVQMTGSTSDSEIFAIKIAKAVGCEIMGIVNPSAPLTWYRETVETLFRYCEADVPFHIASGGTMGLTAPASIAGAVITNCAELIPGLVLAQILRPGARVWVGNFLNTPNMANGAIAFGSIANSLTQAAFNQFWRHSGVPVWGIAPAFSSAKSIDFQCGTEKAMAAILAAVFGSHAIFMHGGVHAELTWHPLQAILDDDIAGMVGRFLQGIEITPDALALQVINQVMSGSGNFLEDDHTLRNWKSIEYIPRTADRLSTGEWTAQGKKGALQRAEARMQEILAHQELSYLSNDQSEAIEEVLREARSYYRQKGLL